MSAKLPRDQNSQDFHAACRNPSKSCLILISAPLVLPPSLAASVDAVVSPAPVLSKDALDGDKRQDTRFPMMLDGVRELGDVMFMSIDAVVHSHQVQQVVVPVLIDLFSERIDQLLVLCFDCGNVDAFEHIVMDRHRCWGDSSRQRKHVDGEMGVPCVVLSAQNR